MASKRGCKRRELDRNAGPPGKPARIGAKHIDGVRIGVEIGVGVFGRARAFAEHVEGIKSALMLGAVNGIFDRSAENEMRAENMHRLPRGLPNGAHADPPREVLHGA